MVNRSDSTVSSNFSADIDFALTLWINKLSNLTSGILKNLYVSVERENADPSLKRLQIWRPVSGSNYRLIWEKTANFSGAYSHELYVV